MENILRKLKEKWEEARAPLETELNSIKKQSEDLKAQHEALVRQISARARLCENKALGLEAEGDFSESDQTREEKIRIEGEIEALKKELVSKLQPLEERRIVLEGESRDLPKKFLDAVFPQMAREGHKALADGLSVLECTWEAILDFEKLTGAKFDNRYLKRLAVYDHSLFNDTKELWGRLRSWIGTPP
jgi:chromosome segregation ATPase